MTTNEAAERLHQELRELRKGDKVTLIMTPLSGGRQTVRIRDVRKQWFRPFAWQIEYSRIDTPRRFAIVGFDSVLGLER